MVKTNAYNRDKNVKEFGIRINERLASVEARVLDPPKLNYHDTGREKHCIPSVGQWNMINKKMVNGATVTHWTCLNLSRLGQSDALRFCNELVQMCSNIGMVGHGAWGAVQAAAGRIELLIIILPDMSGLYGRIKRICETELGMVSQCCQPRHASKPNNKQYLENVALKINVKAGGRNTVLADAISREIPHVTDKEPTIIFGVDVTHPPPGEDSSPSIAAVVASQDWPQIAKYCGLVSAQKHRQEIIQNLFQVLEDPNRGRVNGGMIRELLMSFRRSTLRRPERIIFDRDGVSEGQFNDVLLYELHAIHKACASLEENFLPRVTFVVVQNRHHTRLFATDRQATDRSGNILPGTVVDTKICHPFEFDFYLCSHAGIQGTSRPTHYHVLWDDNGFTADQLQKLTNDLCYTYARCTRSVSVVPPAYYAHLAAFRARYYMEDGASDGGSSVGGTRGHAPAVVRPIPQAKENVKRVMYFC